MFRFGQNWKEYARRALDETKVEQAKQALARLLGQDDLGGKTFMDIGCGSGLHTVSAALLDASAVYALDVDPDCIEVTQRRSNDFYRPPTGCRYNGLLS